MNFSEKVDMIGFFNRSHIKKGISNELYQDIPKCTGFISVSVKHLLRVSIHAHFLG